MPYWLDTTNLTRALRTYVSYMICKCRYIPISKVSIGSGWIPMNSILFCVSITFVEKCILLAPKKTSKRKKWFSKSYDFTDDFSFKSDAKIEITLVNYQTSIKLAYH